MTYVDLNVLIPSHSLEDFPSDLGEQQAASLLNAFAAVWHPAALAAAGVVPSWHRADEPPQDVENRLIIVPTPSEDWLPHGWIESARENGATVISGLCDRQPMIDAVLAGCPSDNSVGADLVADFLALGSCHLQLELLTRHMHHYSQFDEVHLQREAMAAAQAALADDAPAACTHLQSCFDVLTESRERFYPVECYLLDLCLLIPRLADDNVANIVNDEQPINFLVTADDLQEVANERPELVARLREAWEAGTIDIAGGEVVERPLPLLSLQSVVWAFDRGHRTFQKLMGRRPTTWGRRRFGLTTQMPQILSKWRYHSALHFVLDDGIYPDAEQSKIRWEGSDGTVIDATTRIPLAADSASSFLRFSSRMAESMEEDAVAALFFARWPEIKAPWLNDLRRMQRYSPCLGRFVTLNDFFEHTDDPGRLSTFDAKEYLSPFLLQAVARQEDDPISRYVAQTERRGLFDAGCWYSKLADILGSPSVDADVVAACEDSVERSGPDQSTDEDDSVESDAAAQPVSTGDDSGEQEFEQPQDASAAAEEDLEDFVDQSARRLSDVILRGAGDEPGYLLINPLSFPRTVSVELPELSAPSEVAGPVKAVQFDSSRKLAVVEVPDSGFVWVSASRSHEITDDRTTVPMAEENILRNEFFEVHINESTGGIGKIKEYGRKPNRLSQQLALRFSRERTITPSAESGSEPIASYYSEMQLERTEIVSDGPAVGEIVTIGSIIDQQDESRLAGFRQTVRVFRARPIVEVDIELDIERMPEGDPWTNYFASRFAWNDSAASLTRSVLEGAQAFQGERFESSHYLEIATENERTTILNLGLPFHRKTGPRMVDSLLIAEGETRRRFRFVIAVDANYPMSASLDALTPVAVVPTKNGPPRGGTSGWFFRVDAKNVQLVRIMNAMSEPPDDRESWDPDDGFEESSGSGFAVRLVETEGRHQQVKLECFKTPKSARQRDFEGRTQSDLMIQDDSVLIEMMAYEIADVEIRFGEKQ